MGALGLLMVAASAAHAGSLAPQKSQDEMRAVEQGRRLLAGRSARFVENKGQWNREARFLAKGRGLNLWYTDRGIRYDQISAVRGRRQAVDMFFVGGGAARPVGMQKTKARLDVYHGNVTAKNIGSYRELMAKNVLPGVSMRGYFQNEKPRYDLILAPGAKPSSLRIGFKGANGLSLANGELKIGTQLGGIFNGKPVAYQTIGGKHVPVAARWTVSKAGTAGFRVGAYDASKPLVIDPLVYGTYVGGELGPDEVRAAATDPVSGGIVIVGSSAANDFPATSRPFTDTLNPQGVDAFVSRITPNGTTSDYSVLIGGSGDDVAQYLKIDTASGDLWIAGSTTTREEVDEVDPDTGEYIQTLYDGTTNNFPSTALDGGGRSIIGGDARGATNFFVAKLAHSGTALNFGADATDGNGNVIGNDRGNPRVAVVFGLNDTDALTRVTPLPQRAFVSSDVNPNRKFLTGFDLRSLPGQRIEFVMSGITAETPVATGPYGFTYGGLPFTGAIRESESPSDNREFPGRRAGFIFRCQTVGSGPDDGTYFIPNDSGQYIQGNRVSETRGVALDSQGRVYVVGTVFRPTTLSTADPLNIDTAQFPQFFETRLGTFTSQTGAAGTATFDANATSASPRLLRSTDTFVRIYTPFTSATANGVAPGGLEYSALLGGNGIDEAGGVAMSLAASPVYTGSAIAVNADGNIYVTGTTAQAANFPHTAGSLGGNGFVPGGAATSDVYVARIAIRRDGGVTSTRGIVSSRLDFSANLGTTSRILPTPVGGAQNPVLNTSNRLSIDTTSLSIATSAAPAGIAVDSRGYVYVTGNLRPYDIVFPVTFAAPSEPSSSSASAIVTAGTAPLDTVYDRLGTQGPFPTTESYLTVLTPNFVSRQYATYIGGNLDEMVFAPSFDANGNVFVNGWIDGGRIYNVPARTGDPYESYSTLAGFIGNSSGAGVIKGNSPVIFPQDDATQALLGTPTVGVLPFAYGIWATLGDGAQTAIPAYSVARDGFVASINVSLPTPVTLTASLAFASATIDPRTGTLATVSLNVAQAIDTRVRLSPSQGTSVPSLGKTNANALFSLNNVSYDATDDYFYVVVPAGQTAVSFGVVSDKYGNGTSLTLNAQLVSSGLRLAPATVTVRPLDYTLTLNPATLTASTGTTPVTGTITMVVPAVLGDPIVFVVTDPNGNVLGRPVINPGAGTATFTFTPAAVATPTTLVLTATAQTSLIQTTPVVNATTQAVTYVPDVVRRTSSLTLQPVGVSSVAINPTTIRSSTGGEIAVTVTFNNPVDATTANNTAFSFNLLGAFTRVAGTPTANGDRSYTFRFRVNRVSRSQDVTVTASLNSTSANATVTVVR